MSDSTENAVDVNTAQLMRDIEQGLGEAMRGEGRVHTPEQIAARKRGRPVGSVQEVTKVAVKLRLDPDVLAVLRATGKGWQTRANRILRERFAL